jgi:hypothetical protein
VGPVALTDFDLERYQKVRQVTTGVSGDAQALSDLCDRTLLGLEAGERHVEVSEAEMRQELLRRKLIAGAVADTMPAFPPTSAGKGPSVPPSPWQRSGVSPGTRPPMTGAPTGYAPAAPQTWGRYRPNGLPPSPFDRAAQVLAEAGIEENEFAQEVKADVIANKVKQKLVYDKIDVSDKDVLAARRAEPPHPPTAATRPPAASKKGAKPNPEKPDAQALAGVRERLRRKKGEAPLRALLNDLRQRWRVEVIGKGGLAAQGGQPAVAR